MTRARVATWLPPLLMPLVAWLGMAWFLAPPVGDGVAAISQVLRLDSGEPRAVTLPFEARAAVLGTQRVEFEYRFDAGPVPPQALLVLHYDQILEVRLNDHALEGYSQRPNHPRQLSRGAALFALPAALLEPGTNNLRLDVSNARPAGWLELGQIYVGARAPLEARFRRQVALQGTGMLAITLATALIAAFVSVLWLMRPADTVYGWFAAGLICWLVYELNFIWTTQPIPRSYWMAIIHIALAGSLYSLVCFIHRFLGKRHARLERALAWAVALPSLALLAAAAMLEQRAFYLTLHYGYRILLLAGAAYLCVVLLRAAMTSPRRDVLWLLSAAALSSGLAVHDSLRMSGVIDAARPMLFQYGVLATVMVFGWILLERFAGALREAEILNLTLDAKVREKSAELEAQFVDRQRLERENLLAVERQRIMTDMHDGIGGQLAAALAALRRSAPEPAQIERTLATALTDLRLMIDSMDHAGGDLAVALGMFRSRVEPQLAAAGIASRWDTARLPATLSMSPARVLGVFRILQEAVANAIRHAGCRELDIGARLDSGSDGERVEIRVRDDGRGLPEGAAPGRGLGNMRARAAQLGGALHLHSSEAGVEVVLELPVAAGRA